MRPTNHDGYWKLYCRVFRIAFCRKCGRMLETNYQKRRQGRLCIMCQTGYGNAYRKDRDRLGLDVTERPVGMGGVAEQQHAWQAREIAQQICLPGFAPPTARQLSFFDYKQDISCLLSVSPPIGKRRKSPVSDGGGAA